MLEAAMLRIERVAASCTQAEVATEARGIAAGWWSQLSKGGTAMERLPLLVGELRRWCLVTADQHAVRWDRLVRSGRPHEAELLGREAAALHGAAEGLRLYE